MAATSVSSESQSVETLRWRHGRLELIDQRLLPQEIRYVACTDAAQVATAVRDMVVRGAPAIGCAAAFGIALEAARGGNIQAAFDTLASSRPTAVNLFWALDRMRGVIDAGGDPTAEALAIFKQDLEINRAIGRNGAKLIADGARIMTHCNAGALATAGHGTALGVIRSARDAGKRISVIANETRPYLQGARLTAWEMVQEKIPVTLITDNMAGHLMQQGEVDAIVVGADCIAANGDTANKIGTYTLAILASRHGIPFYVAAPVSSFDSTLADGSTIPIEQRAPDEVTGYREMRWAPMGVQVRNPAFDVTPADLITALITERGVIQSPDTLRIAAMIR
jgi:methylthioribose-1-phosphate isomerase